MLKKLRIALATVSLVGLVWLFVDPSGSSRHWLGWMAKMQFAPAVMALNVGVVVLLVVLTLLVGRIYCSVICPLGVLQDIISFFVGKSHPNKNKRRFGRFVYSEPRRRKILRVSVFILFLIAMVAGVGTIVRFLEPYSIFGRIVTATVMPSPAIGLIAGVSLLLLIVLAAIGGRTYCNNICPVGTFLGFLSVRRIWGIRIDPDKCKHCSLCARVCKGNAIDFKNHAVDSTRCVDCFSCLEVCNHDAIAMTKAIKTNSDNLCPTGTPKSNAEPEGMSSNAASTNAGPSRRAFLTATATVLTTGVAMAAEEKIVDGGLATILDKKAPKRQTKLVPPGAVSLKNIQQRCSGCQLCVSKCPNNVLRPSSELLHLMQPVMSYEDGYCRPECHRCSDVCPAGAIIRLPHPSAKSAIKIGTAVWVKENCVPLTDGVSCGNCARHCPSNAIEMVPSDPANPRSLRVPVVNEERCIGCGACENLCPSRPFSAIYVEGIEVHRTI